MSPLAPAWALPRPRQSAHCPHSPALGDDRPSCQSQHQSSMKLGDLSTQGTCHPGETAGQELKPRAIPTHSEVLPLHVALGRGVHAVLLGAHTPWESPKLLPHCSSAVHFLGKIDQGGVSRKEQRGLSDWMPGDQRLGGVHRECWGTCPGEELWFAVSVVKMLHVHWLHTIQRLTTS